jgi:hypothetical protein
MPTQSLGLGGILGSYASIWTQSVPLIFAESWAVKLKAHLRRVLQDHASRGGLYKT